MFELTTIINLRYLECIVVTIRCFHGQRNVRFSSACHFAMNLYKHIFKLKQGWDTYDTRFGLSFCNKFVT
jgi:hypothetical protein